MLPVTDGESDARSAYCAAAIVFILTKNHKDLKVGISLQKLATRIESARAYSGGYGDPSNCESHSGFSYCSVAAL